MDRRTIAVVEFIRAKASGVRLCGTFHVVASAVWPSSLDDACNNLLRQPNTDTSVHENSNQHKATSQYILVEGGDYGWNWKHVRQALQFRQEP